MKIKLYDKDKGYFDAKSVIDAGYTFTFVTGARGIGKTYSVLKYLISLGKPFIYLRRTQDESDMQASILTSSLTKVLNDMSVKYKFGKLSKKIGVIDVYDTPLIYTCALSTFSTIRGVNFDEIKYIVYDEFIPEPHVRQFKAEGLALLNLYETVNRNRELEGGKAVQLIGLSNSLNIANDVFMQFDLVSDAERLTNINDEIYTRDNILLIICKNSPISKAKANTSLYNISEEYSKMAIQNKFILNDFTYVKKRDLKAYNILFQVGDLYFYKHKSEYEWYVTFSKSTTKNIYSNTQADLERFRRAEYRYYAKYLDGYIYFDSYKAIALFEKYYK